MRFNKCLIYYILVIAIIGVFFISGCKQSRTLADECQTGSDCDDESTSTKDICSGTPKKCLNTVIKLCNDDDDYCPPECVYENDNDCGAEIVDCGTSTDISTLKVITKEHKEGGVTSTLSTRDYSADEALVCMGNNLLECNEGKVNINMEGSLVTVEIKEKEGSNCRVRIEYSKMGIEQYRSLSNKYMECPVPINQISSFACPMAGSCPFEGMPGHVAAGSVARFALMAMMGNPNEQGCNVGELK